MSGGGAARRPRIYAHRGASLERPENTMVSFERALELGADALELDVHLTADGHVIVAHDDDGRRMCGVPVPYAKARLDEVRALDAGRCFKAADGSSPWANRGVKIPLFSEVLAAFPRIPINVDLKAPSAALVDAFLHCVRSRGGAEEERVIAASFHRDNLVRVRRAFWQGDTALAQSEVIELLATPAFLWKRLMWRGTAAQLPVRAIANRLDLSSPSLLRKYRAAGLRRIDFWTINDPAEARRLAALGVDGVMTDDPATVVPALVGLLATGVGP